MAIDEPKPDPLAHSQPTPTELGQKLDAILENIQQVGHIRAVEVMPRDVIVYTTQAHITGAQGQRVHERLKQLFPEQEILILGGGDEIGVIAFAQNMDGDHGDRIDTTDLEGRSIARARDPNSPL